MGIIQPDGSYDYKLAGYTMNYRIKESGAGVKTVEWISLKRRLSFLERNFKKIEKTLNNFFLYHRWSVLFQPLVVVVLIASLIIFYFGIRENSLKRIERFKWVVAQIAGVSPESIEYRGEGWFKISGQRRTLEKETKPVIISFNPLSWLFFPDTANVSNWSKKLDRYITYPIAMSDSGDVWLDKRDSQIHGKVIGNKIIWDEPQRTGISQEVSGHRIAIEDGQLKFIDE